METQRITQSFGGGGVNRQLSPGYVLVDRYLIQEVIGVGGMGSVYRARDLHFPNVVKIVAVKEMINQARDPMVRQTILHNFEREANLLVTLNHVAIPKIFDYFTHDERSYLVLEYINGKDLEAILNETEGFLPEDQVVKWAIEICDVLDYLHNHKPEPIIFRDLKPSNVMINQNGHVMLIDFGIAKLFREGQKGTMIGTEGYSPPEQYRGEATPLADIYALGATLHHLLTKRDPRLEPPFSFAERPIRKINPGVSPELETIVNTALQYNPEDRFPSAAVMKEALLAAARKTGILSRISLPTTMKEEKIKPLWVFKCEDEVRGSPFYDNGVIYIGSYDNNLYALDATSGEFRWKFPTEGAIVGRPVAYQDIVVIGSKDSFLYCVSARTGKLIWSHKTEGAIHSSPRVGEGHVFFGSDDGYFYAVNLASGRRTWRLDVGDPIRSTPFLTNEFIYFGTEGGDFLCLDYRGQIKWRFRAKRAITSSPTVAQGMVYFTSLDASFYALDSKSGWMIWRFRMGKGSVSSPCHVDNFVFAGSADGYIYCLDANTSKEIWRFQTNHQVSGSPIIYKDNLYCGSADGNLYCLEYKTGKLRWKFATDGPITGTPTAFNNVIYFGSSDHMVYALLA
ncbi:PQQ-binding-like beta-propeller repeat protein [Thermanaerothrix sp.]|uniref:beta-alanine-activating enzyme beta-propeller domain-containing protein n=1 Tax=Thermanaerothrix sp. TaxID=2972675 RepID=UPI003C7D39CE